MANLIERGLDRVNKRFRYFTPIVLLALGLGSMGYAGSLFLEWSDLGNPQSANSSGQVEESWLDGKSGSGEPSGAAETRQDPESMVRLRRNLLLTGVGILAVIGSMSIAFSVLWFGLVRVQLSRTEETPPGLN